MTASEVAVLAQASERKPGHYEGPCPVHGGRSGRSLAIRDAGDRVLIHCRGGCSTTDVLAAIGLTMADLFAGAAGRPNNHRHRRERHAARVLAAWRLVMLRELSALLRRSDRLAQAGADAVRMDAMPTGQIDGAHESGWSALQTAYHAQTLLEYDYDRLSGSDRAAWLAVYREHREAGHAA